MHLIHYDVLMLGACAHYDNHRSRLKFLTLHLPLYIYLTLQTGMYYLRTKPAVNAIQYTVEKGFGSSSSVPTLDESEICMSCQA